MDTTHHSIDALVAQAKKRQSTEELLLYIAVEDGVLALCQKLINHESEELVQQFEQTCEYYTVNSTRLLANIKEVVRSLSAADSDISYAYSTLELEETATLEEVKRAFRALCKKYHPDHAREQDSAEKFLEIQEAYNTIVEHDTRVTAQPSTPWVQPEKPKKQKNIKGKLRFLYGVVGLVFVLIITSVILENKNTSRALQQRSLKKQANAEQQTAKTEEKDKKKTANTTPTTSQDPQQETQTARKPKEEQKAAPEVKDEPSIAELEAAIPPDPELLATLEQPFPFSINALEQQQRPAISKTKSKAKVTSTHKDTQKEDTEKEQQLADKIKALEDKIKQLEEKTKTNESQIQGASTAATQPTPEQEQAKEQPTQKKAPQPLGTIKTAAKAAEVAKSSPPKKEQPPPQKRKPPCRLNIFWKVLPQPI